ncbi:MAG: hypothetical protein R3F11_17610, partial [Verrucomicrobiales bacterium]
MFSRLSPPATALLAAAVLLGAAAMMVGCSDDPPPKPPPGAGAAAAEPQGAGAGEGAAVRARQAREASAQFLLARRRAQRERAADPDAAPKAAPLSEVPRALADAAAALSEADLAAMVPDQSPGIAVACPAEAIYHGPRNEGWRWDPANPDAVTCAHCGTAFPNAEFPTDASAIFRNFAGEEVPVNYHAGKEAAGLPAANPNPERYFLNAVIDDKKYAWCLEAATALGTAYRATGEARYGTALARLLDGLSQRYKRFIVHGGGAEGHYVSTGGPFLRGGRQGGREGEDMPYEWGDGRLVGAWQREVEPRLIAAYAAIKGSRPLEDLTDERGADIGLGIEKNLIRAMVDFVLLVPWAEHTGHAEPVYVAPIAEAALAVGEPTYAHFAHRYVTEIFKAYGPGRSVEGFSRDLIHPAGAAAHYDFIAAVQAAAKPLAGYSDPDGYANPETGRRIDDFDPAKGMPDFARAAYAPEALAFPDGTLYPVPGAPPGGRSQGILPRPRPAAEPAVFTGYGHAILGGGAGLSQFQLHADFPAGEKEGAAGGSLGIAWFAHGMLGSGPPDPADKALGGWADATLSRNTVVVDRDRQRKLGSPGRVTLFDDTMPGIQILQVEDPGCYYVSRCTKYR